MVTVEKKQLNNSLKYLVTVAHSCDAKLIENLGVFSREYIQDMFREEIELLQDTEALDCFSVKVEQYYNEDKP